MASLSLSDAHDLVSKKILISNMAIENLNYQIKFSTAMRKFQLLSAVIAQKKIVLITRLNDILNKQLNEFCEIRQEECKNIYDEINQLDTPTSEMLSAINDCRKYEEDMLTLMPKIQYIESTIPPQLNVTNYKIKPTATAPTASTCATEVLAFGIDDSPV